MTQIEDGTGTGKRATVDVNNRLHTDAVTRTEIHNQVLIGEAWNMSTGKITLTSATESSLFYLKNTGQRSLFIDLYVVLTGASTGGTGLAEMSIVRNPLAGTVVSTATPVTNIVNMEFGSSNTPDADIFSGVEAATLTGFVGTINSQTTASSRLLLGVLTSVPQGASVGINITPPAGNTSMDVEVAIEVFEEEEL